jgi:branched-subunit amino acid transport protein
MSTWATVFAAGAITYLTRASFIVAGDRVGFPPIVERSLRYVAPASFAAIALPAMLGGDRFASFGDDWPRIIAVCVAAVIIVRWRNVPASLLAGMVTLWLILGLT